MEVSAKHRISEVGVQDVAIVEDETHIAAVTFIYLNHTDILIVEHRATASLLLAARSEAKQRKDTCEKKYFFHDDEFAILFEIAKLVFFFQIPIFFSLCHLSAKHKTISQRQQDVLNTGILLHKIVELTETLCVVVMMVRIGHLAIP